MPAQTGHGGSKLPPRPHPQSVRQTPSSCCCCPCPQSQHLTHLEGGGSTRAAPQPCPATALSGLSPGVSSSWVASPPPAPAGPEPPAPGPGEVSRSSAPSVLGAQGAHGPPAGREAVFPPGWRPPDRAVITGPVGRAGGADARAPVTCRPRATVGAVSDLCRDWRGERQEQVVTPFLSQCLLPGLPRCPRVSSGLPDTPKSRPSFLGVNRVGAWPGTGDV